MPFRPVLSALAVAVAFAMPVSAGTWQVSGVAAGDVLNLRNGPSTRFEVVMGLPNAFGGLRKEVCVLLKPAPEAPAAADLPEWCAVSNGGPILGWVNARYLAPEAPVPADLPLMGGFRGHDDPCRIVGESAATVDYLDHTRWLVGCPTGSPGIAEVLAQFGGEEVGRIGGYTLLSMPQPQ